MLLGVLVEKTITYIFLKKILGLEALLQTISCKDLIGWRQGVRRVIIFMTDQVRYFFTWVTDFLIRGFFDL